MPLILRDLWDVYSHILAWNELVVQWLSHIHHQECPVFQDRDLRNLEFPTVEISDESIVVREGCDNGKRHENEAKWESEVKPRFCAMDHQQH